MDESQNKNKSPVIHIENHLGLESWCAQHVYRHAHDIILASSRKHPLTMCHVPSDDRSGGGSAGTADRENCTKLALQPFSSNLVKYLNCAILINPDVATFWNCRRRLFQKNRLDIRREFQFSSIVLSKKPKSNDAFFYRRWLYSFQSHESIDWTRELSLCERCASKSLSNYHAWCHRQWVLQKAPFLLQYELATTERFIRKHIGDYSGYHHRQFVLRKMYELCYCEQEPMTMAGSNGDGGGGRGEYLALVRYLTSIGCDVTTSIDATALMHIIVPRRNLSRITDPDKIKMKSFLYCLNVCAYDLEFVEEMRQMYGYREAFECHRKAIVKFMVDKCLEWSLAAAGTSMLNRCKSMPNRDQPLEKMMKTTTNHDTDGASGLSGGILTALKRTELDNGNEMHRKWCDIFLKF